MARRCPLDEYMCIMTSVSMSIYNPLPTPQVRVVLVPKFQRSRSCVLVNLRTLECDTVSFAGL